MARPKKKYQLDFTVDVHSPKFKTREEIILSSKNKQKIMELAIARYVVDNSSETNIESICNRFNISVNTFKSKLYKMSREQVQKIAYKNFVFKDIPEDVNDEERDWIIKELLAFSLEGQYEEKLNELKQLVKTWEEKAKK